MMLTIRISVYNIKFHINNLAQSSDFAFLISFVVGELLPARSLLYGYKIQTKIFLWNMKIKDVRNFFDVKSPLCASHLRTSRI